MAECKKHNGVVIERIEKQSVWWAFVFMYEKDQKMICSICGKELGRL